MMQAQRSRKDKRVPNARRLRRDATDAERKLWARLRQASFAGTHFRRQATIGPYFADFACHTRRIVIEIDGGQHNEARRVVADEQRTAYLQKRGYKVLRFWNNDVMGNIEGVLASIQATLTEPEIAPHP
ncbi:MAG TPA: endonuclease domain-containing protein [Pseudolabrys sp.]|nr:endonuclease domain-containing protein [Pseudolabrys sp.]